MQRRILVAGVLAAAMAASGGCCCTSYSCADGGCGGVAAPCGCDTCGGGAPCDDCGGDTCCGGGASCDGCGCGFGLWADSCSCKHGCGEVYWGEWVSDPPAPCDPCDNCGNWVGPQCCGESCFWTGLCKLWGFRYTPSCEPGCSECGGVGGCSCGDCGGSVIHGGVIETMASDARATAGVQTASKRVSPRPARQATR